jgi:hypothetical protein
MAPPPAKLVRRTSKKPEAKPFVLAASPYKQASVKDKVKTWNQNGGGLYGTDNSSDDSIAQAIAVSSKSGSEPTASSSRQSGSDVKSKTRSAKTEETGSTEIVRVAEEEDGPPTESGDGSECLGSKSSGIKSASQPSSSTLPSEQPPIIQTVMPGTPTTPIRYTTTVTPKTVPQRPTALAATPKSAPARPVMLTRRAKPNNNKLDDDVKAASAPKKRVVSDGHWVRHRAPKIEPKKKASPPKPPKPIDLKLAWVRPPMLPRRDPDDDRPTPRLELDLSLPPMRTYTGKLKKPILHKFVPGQNAKQPRPNLATGIAVRNSASPSNRTGKSSQRRQSISEDDSYYTEDEDDMTSIVTPLPPPPRRRSKGTVRRRRVRPPTPTDDDSSYETVSEDMDLRRNTSVQKTPPLSQGRRRSQPGPQSAGSRSKPEIIDGLSQPTSAVRFDLRDTVGASKRQYHHQRSASENPENHPIRRARETYYEQTEEHRKPSFNAGDVIPPLDPPGQLLPPNGTVNRISAWLTAATDPFTDRTKKSPASQKSSRRIFSFETPDTETTEPSKPRKSPTPSPTKESQTTLKSSLKPPRESPKAIPVEDEDASTISASTERQSRVTRQSEYSQVSSELSSNASTATLKRSGARKNSVSPTKLRPRSVSSAQDTETDVSQSMTATSYTATSYTGTSYTESSGQESSLGSTSNHPITPPTGARSLDLRRPFPSTGHRLSTIVSVETLNTEVKESADVPPPDLKASGGSGGSRHVLASPGVVRMSSRSLASKPGGLLQKSKSVLSTRSNRSQRSRMKMTIPELMAEVTADEERYMPELRTLVGGVIQVLLKAALSKSDAAAAAGLFSRFATQGSEKEATKAIHEICVALERLKTNHNRIPKTDARSLLVWAKQAHKVYEEYVRTWRLGFHDVVVNLVPADDASSVSDRDIEGSMANALPRNSEGYVVNQEGELVDVAFLLKRPLVRLKHLAKTIKVCLIGLVQ